LLSITYGGFAEDHREFSRPVITGKGAILSPSLTEEGYDQTKRLVKIIEGSAGEGLGSLRKGKRAVDEY